jgi:myo-inositol-1(or 4)-monophosphatase
VDETTCAAHPVDDLLALAVDLSHRAGALLQSAAGTARLMATKSSPTDAVTEADRRSEDLIRAGIAEARPGDAILGEEQASTEGTTGIRWVVDPLDGTVNFLYGHPSGWAVSIAAEDAEGPLVGAVYDPPRAETFTAVRGRGAWRDGGHISVSHVDTLAAALVATGFSYVADRRKDQARLLLDVLPAVRDIRRAGSAALDLCWVACGRLDGFYEWGLQPWDWSAGSLIVSQTGGRFARHADGLVVAGPPAVFRALSGLLGHDG